MSANKKRRLTLYGLGALVLAGLVYGGFIYRADQDFGSMVANAEALAQWGEVDDAIELAERARAKRPDHRYLHIVLAHCYVRKCDYDRAADFYRSAIDLTVPGDSTGEALYLYLAEALANGGRVDEAKKEIEELIDRNPEMVRAYALMGSICYSNGDTGEAIAVLRSGMEKLPEDHQLPGLLGEIEYSTGRSDAAKGHLERAVQLAEKRSETVESDLRGLENAVEAESLRAEAVTLTRKRAGLSLGLARILATEGLRMEAEQQILVAAALDRRLTAQTIRTDEVLQSFGETPNVIDGLKSPKATETVKKNQKRLK